MDCCIAFTRCNEPSLNDVPLELLGIIFSHLDIHHQARAYRVSRMWRAVISACWPLEHVEINCQLGKDPCPVYPVEYKVSLDVQEAKIDTMLHVTLSNRTKSLTLRNIALSHRRIMMLIVDRFNGNKRKLPVLCFKDCIVGTEMTLFPWRNNALFDHWNQSNLLLFIRHQPCEKMLLLNHTIRDIMDYHYLLDVLGFIHGMIRKAGTAGTISRLVVDCGKSDMDVFHSLLTALNDDWPSVGENVRENVAAVHKQWVENEDNPAKWIAFRNVVYLFTYHSCADPYREYPKNDEDVKGLSIAQLNDMTVAFLALLFKAYEANY